MSIFKLPCLKYSKHHLLSWLTYHSLSAHLHLCQQNHRPIFLILIVLFSTCSFQCFQPATVIADFHKCKHDLSTICHQCHITVHDCTCMCSRHCASNTNQHISSGHLLPQLISSQHSPPSSKTASSY